MFKLDFDVIANKAREAGLAAVAALQVVPMVVSERANPLDDSSPVKRQWLVEDGVCGFAGIKFKGNTAWAKYAKKYLGARPDYPSGVYLNVSAFNQSLQKKEAYASAYAQVLRDNGIEAYMTSRMD